MKLSHYIKQLENILEKHGDNELSFAVKDDYSIYGEQAMCILNTEGNSIWDGVTSTEGNTTLKLSLKTKDGKSPKITFRN